MLQLKVFYNISFPDGERCEAIFIETMIQTFEDLMRVVREKIECFQFIPDTEIRAQYFDDENTLINLRPGDILNDALRCAQQVTGARFSRLKVKLTWQPKSTPEMVSIKRREMHEPTSSETRGELNSKKQLVYGNYPNFDSMAQSSTATTTSNSPQHATHSPLPGVDKNNPSPPRKRNCLDPAKPAEERASPNFVQPKTYLSPLDLLILDKQKEFTDERKRVLEKEKEVQNLFAEYSKQVGVDYSKPACTICHRRERHNRTNCPYKGHPCSSAKFCGDLNKHRDEKDMVSVAKNELNAVKKNLGKLQNALTMKIALKNQTTNSFSSVMRSRLINECKERYLTSQGHENWRQVNMDLKKLESYFKGKIPDFDVSLINALAEYDKICQFKVHSQSNTASNGNPIRSLWELKGIKWPSESPEPLQFESSNQSSFQSDDAARVLLNLSEHKGIN